MFRYNDDEVENKNKIEQLEDKVEELEKKHKINERAIRDGSGEQPPEKDPGYTVVENEISLECGNYLEEHTEKLRVYLKKVHINTYSSKWG